MHHDGGLFLPVGAFRHVNMSAFVADRILDTGTFPIFTLHILYIDLRLIATVCSMIFCVKSNMRS